MEGKRVSFFLTDSEDYYWYPSLPTSKEETTNTKEEPSEPLSQDEEEVEADFAKMWIAKDLMMKRVNNIL